MLVSGGGSSGGSSASRQQNEYLKFLTNRASSTTSKGKSNWRRENQGPVNDSPWRNQTIDRRTPVTTPVTTTAAAAGAGLSTGYGSPGGSSGSGYGSSGGYSAPQQQKLSYKELRALARVDPRFLEQKAGFGRLKKLSRSQARASKGLLNTDFQGELGILKGDTEEARRLAEEEAAAMGRIRSNPYARRLDSINEDFENSRGRLQRQRSSGISQIDQALQSALLNYTLEQQQARQDAINRLLAQRTDISRGF